MKKVCIVVYQSKHVSPLDAIEVWATEDLAYRSIADIIKIDIQEGRYSDDEVVERDLLNSITIMDWGKMMAIHDCYWESYSQPDVWTVLEKEVISNF